LGACAGSACVARYWFSRAAGGPDYLDLRQKYAHALMFCGLRDSKLVTMTVTEWGRFWP
jgi:hypothetical protein